MGTASEAAFDFRIADESPGAGTSVLALYGEADQFIAGELRDRLSSTIDDGGEALVVDLSGVTFVDSMVLGILLGALKRMGIKGGELRLVLPESDVRRVFEITLLDRVFALDITREEALAAIERTASGGGGAG